jgi:hypothetical protein
MKMRIIKHHKFYTRKDRLLVTKDVHKEITIRETIIIIIGVIISITMKGDATIVAYPVTSKRIVKTDAPIVVEWGMLPRTASLSLLQKTSKLSFGR